jgi:hypothetical protein
MFEQLPIGLSCAGVPLSLSISITVNHLQRKVGCDSTRRPGYTQQQGQR